MDPRFLIFPIIGAIIGAVTNQIAIKMLFRPYKPVRIGSWRLPLTPGVIPAQRHIIAGNIAETFEAQLFSGDEIHKFLTGPKARTAVEEKVEEMIAGLGPMGAMARGFQPMIVEKLLSGIEGLATDAVSHGAEFDIGQRIEDKINGMDIRELERLVLGFSSKQFRHITFFGGVLGFAIGVIQAAISIFWM